MQHTQSFIAKDEEGNVYRLEVWQDEVDAGTRANPTATSSGKCEIRDADGDRWNRAARGEYMRVFDRLRATSDDPDAP